MRIDLFVAPGCPGCPAAREVIESFARTTPGVQVHEWDLSSDPGPAVGRGIFATPTLLIDGVHILPGVPRTTDLERRLGPDARTTPPGSPEQKAPREMETVFDSSHKPPLPNDLDRNIRRVRAVFSSEDSETRT